MGWLKNIIQTRNKYHVTTKKKYDLVIEKLLDINKESGCTIQRTNENTCIITVPFDFEKYKEYYAFNINNSNDSAVDNLYAKLYLVFCLIPLYYASIKYNGNILYGDIDEEVLYYAFHPNDPVLLNFYHGIIRFNAYGGSDLFGEIFIDIRYGILANPSVNQLSMVVMSENGTYSLDDICDAQVGSSYEDQVFNILNTNSSTLKLFGIKKQYLE